MSDERRHEDTEKPADKQPQDRWTEGPELSARQAQELRQAQQGKSASAPASDNPEVLREQQRLVQQEMLDRWIGGVLVEQRRARRWKLFFRFLFLGVLLLFVLSAFYSLFVATSSVPEREHLGVVTVRGVIDSESPASRSEEHTSELQSRPQL